MPLVKFSLRVCLRTMWLMDINNNIVGLLVVLIIGEMAGIRAEGKSSRVASSGLGVPQSAEWQRIGNYHPRLLLLLTKYHSRRRPSIKLYLLVIGFRDNQLDSLR